ncbi:MAG: electron transfer flavoprotein subunit alpha/FixB family protein [Gemmatimonadota bacterium]|nr:electron transfer flavoprotein subunit alpha/FixB family protein [Gemmatimonadota bacterium]
MANVLAVVEIRGGEATKAARETVSAARAVAGGLGGAVHVVAVGGPGTGAGAETLAANGADRICVAESPDLELYQPDVVAGVVAGLAGDGGYGAAMFAATAQGKDLAPRVAARLDRPLATEVVAVSADGGQITVRRPMYAGKAIATLRFGAAPALMTLRANVFAPTEAAGAGEVEDLEVGTVEPRARVTAFEAGDRDQLDVSEASIIVSGGRGMQDPENWHLLEALVDALGAEATLGASRAVVDAGWRPHAEQVGQTGKTVSPNLYFAVGISGAIQHLAGMRTAKTIVAINRDAEAPIFGVADYGVVGDLFEILPRLTEEVRKARASG